MLDSAWHSIDHQGLEPAGVVADSYVYGKGCLIYVRHHLGKLEAGSLFL